jgi:hypothetical protein
MSTTTQEKQRYAVLTTLTASGLSIDDLALLLRLDAQRLLIGRKLHLVVGDMFYDGLLSRTSEKGNNLYRPTALGLKLAAELVPPPVAVAKVEAPRLPDPVREPAKLDEPVDSLAPAPGISLSAGRPARSFAVPESKVLPMPERVVVPPTPTRGGNLPLSVPSPVAQPVASRTVSAPAPVAMPAGPVEPTLQRLIQAFQHDRARTTAMEKCLREIAAVVQRHYPV